MKFIGQTFKNETIDIDYNEFFNCKFENCVLVYHGGKPPLMTKCDLSASSFSFAEGAAATVQFMTAMYHGGFKVVIEQTFENIKANKSAGKITFN
jgi:hypothetical protein